MFACIDFKQIKKTAKTVLIAVSVLAVIICKRSIFDKRSILTSADGKPKGYIAIIIDDFGYNGEGTEEMLALDIPFTAAIMPFSEKSSENVEEIKNAGKEYIIHMPMESLTGKRSWVGDKGIFTNMSSEEIAKRVDEAFETADGAAGMNNHMGSAVMENESCLSAVLDAVKEHDAVFIDSVTSGKSKGEKLCKEKGICFFKRDVFLDSTRDINVVTKRLEEAKEKALKNGFAIAIGHVGPEGGKTTAQAIKQMTPKLMSEGIEFVTISKMKELIENDGRGIY